MRTSVKDPQLLLLLLTTALLAVAISRPTVSLERDVFKYIFVFDITQSMNIRDAGRSSNLSSRLDFAKTSVDQGLQRLPCGSEAGLGIFTEHRTFLLVAPVDVCANYGVLAKVLAQIDWRMAWVSRSEVAKGLYSGLTVVSELGGESRLVFLSDGHEAPPIHPDFRPTYKDVPSVTGLIIGVGGLNPVPIPRLDDAGKLEGYWSRYDVAQIDRYSLGRNDSGGDAMVGVRRADIQKRIEQGTEHLSSVRETYLRQLGNETNLEYYRPEITSQLAEHLVRAKFANKKTSVVNLQWLPGLIALLSFLLASTKSLSDRQKKEALQREKT